MKNDEGWRCWAEIDLDALQHNFRACRLHLKKATGLVPAVKANAYGHGIEIVAPALERAGARMFGVANVAEACELRRLKIRLPILILGDCLHAEVKDVVEGNFIPTLSAAHEVDWFEREAARQGKRDFLVHAKIDTGMGRLGCWHGEARPFLEKLLASKHLRLGGLMSHFSCADTSRPFTRTQWARLESVKTWLSTACRRRFLLHAANSAALLRFPEMQGDIVRPGIALYGAAPARGLEKFLRPVMAWKTRVTFIKNVRRGHPISYGATFRAPRDMRVAVLGAGYADGYPRSLSSRGEVVLLGRKCPVLGRVTMDQTVVDVTGMLGVENGTEALLMGGQGVSAGTIARMTGTISYEIFTGVSARVRRVPVGSAANKKKVS